MPNLLRYSRWRGRFSCARLGLAALCSCLLSLLPGPRKALLAPRSSPVVPHQASTSADMSKYRRRAASPPRTIICWAAATRFFCLFFKSHSSARLRAHILVSCDDSESTRARGDHGPKPPTHAASLGGLPESFLRRRSFARCLTGEAYPALPPHRSPYKLINPPFPFVDVQTRVRFFSHFSRSIRRESRSLGRTAIHVPYTLSSSNFKRSRLPLAHPRWTGRQDSNSGGSSRQHSFAADSYVCIRAPFCSFPHLHASQDSPSSWPDHDRQTHLTHTFSALIKLYPLAGCWIGRSSSCVTQAVDPPGPCQFYLAYVLILLGIGREEKPGAGFIYSTPNLNSRDASILQSYSPPPIHARALRSASVVTCENTLGQLRVLRLAESSWMSGLLTCGGYYPPLLQSYMRKHPQSASGSSGGMSRLFNIIPALLQTFHISNTYLKLPGR
ncbi:hypothetical protein FB451DRAFT_156175 [Mycena latifolia]|nr:hypothetical protein FB451DRAFT_156175 [Mycena latifolia]